MRLIKTAPLRPSHQLLYVCCCDVCIVSSYRFHVTYKIKVITQMQLFFSGLSNLRYPSKRKELAAAKRSLYYLWWRFLRLSEDYWWLCQFNGKSKDKEFNETYKKFGNVFDGTFEDWWAARGADLFAYKLEPPKVEWLDKGKFYGKSEDYYKVLLIPKNLTKSEIASQVRKVLATHKKAPLSKRIRYDVSISDTRGMKRPVLESVFDVWSLNQVLKLAIQNGRLDRPERFTQYWMGKQLNLMRTSSQTHFVNIETQAKHQLALRVKVNRYLSKAQSLIANTEYGKFPDVKKIKQPSRWTESQKSQMNAQLGGQHWMSPEIDSKRFLKMLNIDD